jgi:hypothetical protein
MEITNPSFVPHPANDVDQDQLHPSIQTWKQMHQHIIIIIEKTHQRCRQNDLILFLEAARFFFRAREKISRKKINLHLDQVP